MKDVYLWDLFRVRLKHNMMFYVKMDIVHECFNETVEEGLQSLYPLINEKGMDWMFSNCSTTAQRGALDWSKIFYQHIKPVITHCYRKVFVMVKNQKDQ